MSTSAVSNLSQSTDYNLSKLNLISTSQGTISLKPYLVELNYFEDIYNNTVSGKIVISDAVGVILMSSLKGSELIEMEFVKGTGGNAVSNGSKIFNIFSVSERHFDPSNNFETYVINFCSEDLMLSERYRVSKSYPKPMLISDIVKDILDNILQTGTSYDVEQTTRTYNFVLPNKKIFETINWLASYALPNNGKSGADMLFFENSKGYQFKSLQTLYDQSPSYTYYYNPKNVLTPSYKSNLQPDNIFRLEVLNNFDTFDAIMKGTFSSRLITFDPLRRRKETKDFDYKEYSSRAKVLNKSKDSIYDLNYRNRFHKTLNDAPPPTLNNGALRMMITNTGTQQEQYVQSTQSSDTTGYVNDYAVETFLTNRMAQLSLANYTKIKIIIPGNSDILVGMILKIGVFGVKPVSNERQEDTILSGNYLVTAARHIVSPVGYRTVVELAKDSNIG